MAELLVARLSVAAVGSVFAVLYLVLHKILLASAGVAWRETMGAFLVVFLLLPMPVASPISAYSIFSIAVTTEQAQWTLTDRFA